MSRILIVDDEDGIREILRDYLEIEGHDVVEATGGHEAWAFLAKEEVDLVVTDVKMPAGMGTDLLRQIKDRDSRVPSVIFITGHSDFSIDEAYAMGVEGFLHKPFTRQSLLEVVSRMTKPHPGTDEGAYKIDRLPVFDLKIADLENGVRTGRLAVGRGGFCVRDPGVSLTTDQVYAIRFGDRVFGAGIVRWSRSQGRLDQSGDAGVEMLWLSPEHTETWNRTLSQVDSRIYIPRQVVPGKI